MKREHEEEMTRFQKRLNEEHQRQLALDRERLLAKRKAIEARKKEIQDQIEAERKQREAELAEQERILKEKTEKEAKRRKKQKAILEKIESDIQIYTKPAYSSWTEELKPEGTKQTPPRSLLKIKDGKTTTHSRGFLNAQGGQASLELLERIKRMEGIVTGMNVEKYTKVKENLSKIE